MTAVEELIKEIQELKKTLIYPSSFKAIDNCIDLCYAKLELEKQQIFGAYVVANGELIEHSIPRAEQYYNETYKI